METTSIPPWIPKLINIEFEFDRFIQTFRAGKRVTEHNKGIHVEGLNADYYFEFDQIIIELKSLENDQSDFDSMHERLKKILIHFGYDGNNALLILHGLVVAPKNVAKAFDVKMGSALKGALRKANRQISSTKKLLNVRESSGILIVANDGDYGLNPAQAAHFLAGAALRLSTCHVDAIVYTTPNVFYHDGSNFATQYWHPIYADGKEQLSDFVNQMGEAWIEYLSRITGDSIMTRQIASMEDGDITAAPIYRLGK